MWLTGYRYFVRPPDSVFTAPDLEFDGGFHTYGEYNYLKPGLVSRVKTAHFERALELSRDLFGACNAIDFGCADGVFLPSLASHFPHVLAVDQVPKFIGVAKRLVDELALENVDLVCNDGVPLESLPSLVPQRGYGVAFCLETLEHVGAPGDLYGPKIRLLEGLFSLLEPGGRIVISVPKMVGVPFLIQRAALAATGSLREPIALGDLLRAGLLKDTRNLEPHWDGGHLGFNHLRLEEALRDAFHVERRSDIVFQVMYVVRRR